jgi:hypothetical protein
MSGGRYIYGHNWRHVKGFCRKVFHNKVLFSGKLRGKFKNQTSLALTSGPRYHSLAVISEEIAGGMFNPR